jgi:hypothetical protein
MSRSSKLLRGKNYTPETSEVRRLHRRIKGLRASQLRYKTLYHDLKQRVTDARNARAKAVSMMAR